MPLLIFSRPSRVERQLFDRRLIPTPHIPGHAQQTERLGPRFQSLRAAFDARRLELQASANNSDPDLVVVFETVEPVNDFILSAERIPGLEWLAGMIEAQIEPDEHFYWPQDANKALNGKLFLMGSNRRALEEVVRLWEQRDAPTSVMGKGLSAWKDLFLHQADRGRRRGARLSGLASDSGNRPTPGIRSRERTAPMPTLRSGFVHARPTQRRQAPCVAQAWRRDAYALCRRWSPRWRAMALPVNRNFGFVRWRRPCRSLGRAHWGRSCGAQPPEGLERLPDAVELRFRVAAILDCDHSCDDDVVDMPGW